MRDYPCTLRDSPGKVRDSPNAMREAPYLASAQEVKSNSRDKRSDVAAAERQQAGCSHINPVAFPQPTDHTSVHPSAHLDILLYLITVLRGLGLVLNEHLYSFSSSYHKSPLQKHVLLCIASEVSKIMWTSSISLSTDIPGTAVLSLYAYSPST